jgi:two-component system, chemotaxis family, sensor kinase CheA
MTGSGAKGLEPGAFHAIFFEEADEHLAAVETMLLGLDPEAPDAEALNGIFRAVHSIKGSAGMLGFTEIVSLTHAFENLLDLLRKQQRPVSHADVEAMLRSGDVVKMQVAFRRGALASPPDMTVAEAELRALISVVDPTAVQAFTVKLGPLAEPIEASALETMLGGLAAMGQVDAPQINNAAGGEIAFGVSLAGCEADLRSVLSLVVPAEHIHIAPAGAPEEPAPAAPVVEEKPAVAQAAAADPAGVDMFTSPEAWRERRQGRGRRSSDALGTTLHGRRESDRAAVAQGEAGSIRVSVEKIDRLVNLVGELVITEAMLSQQAAHAEGNATTGDAGGLAGLSDLARHTRNLQEAVMAIRMVPISAVFSRFPRLVRELSQRLGKEVEIKVSGEATELDRGLIERITDPLTHLVRNAIDHGIELPEVRAAAGKPRCGTIWLSAMQRGGRIIIEVRDDGRGLDRSRILKRAAERGMTIAADAADQDVWRIIFEPGFSTAETVTDVSGRGVGMDVVRRNIQVLSGNVELASTAGKGMAVTVSVPLTLAIIEAMTVGAAGETYVLPLASVIESRSVQRDEIRSVAGQGHTLRVRDEYVPVRRLGSSDEIAVIVEADGARAALLVDELIGQQQVVVKSLETNFRKVPGISGATIMGDGKVALILDLAHIIGQPSGRAQWKLH